VARAIDVAAQRWPGEPRSRLLLRLIEAGRATLDLGADAQARERRAAIRATRGKYADAFPADYLAQLRQDWPE
jgi:hypothetical protein